MINLEKMLAEIGANMSPQDIRLWGCQCIRQPQVWGKLSPQSKAAVETAEAFARGTATAEELAAAGKVAFVAWEDEHSSWDMADASMAAFHITGPLLSDISDAAMAAAYAEVEDEEDANAINVVRARQAAALAKISPELSQEWFMDLLR